MSEGQSPSPPASIEAEQALLGVILYDNEALHGAEGVTPESFLEPFHGRLFEAITRIVQRGHRAEAMAVHHAVEADPAYADMGGMSYLADLVDHAPPTSTAGDWARIILDAALRRSLITFAGEMTKVAKDGAQPAEEHLHAAEKALSEMAHRATTGSAWVGAGDVVDRAIAAGQGYSDRKGISTGLTQLDDALGGLQRGQMMILAARPAMGKSTGGLALAKAVARKGRGVAFFSLEMPEVDLGIRLACDVAYDPELRYAGLDSNPTYFAAARNRLSAAQWRRLEDARQDIREWPLLFDTRAGLSVPKMLAAARRQMRK